MSGCTTAGPIEALSPRAIACGAAAVLSIGQPTQLSSDIHLRPFFYYRAGQRMTVARRKHH
jgi:hypothetical protein